MKGFLSLLGITLIVAAFGLILLTYSDIPLEDMKRQERINVYMETRQNHPAENLKPNFLSDVDGPSENLRQAQKKEGSD